MVEKTHQKTLSRLFRPKRFDEVYGQTTVITTLINSLKSKKTSQAYLFTGIRGTGKTTLARIFAKALNCENNNDSVEPCNHCISCKEIDSSSSLSVIEIDGASNRGIDDIREINETAHFSSCGDSFKIIIIDEVHMLTKEAFNALLKTLEEPPAHVKFFFATTEVNKIPATILSRTQRFDLKRLTPLEVLTKLQKISTDLEIKIEEDALKIIARKSEGSLRDAESLLQQIRCFENETISQELIQQLFGIIPQDFLFELDAAYKEKNISFAFDQASRLFSLGPTLPTFIESLLEHYRNITLLLLKKRTPDTSSLTKNDLQGYKNTFTTYSLEKVLHILDFLSDILIKIPVHSSKLIHFEMILLHIIQTSNRVTIESILDTLNAPTKNSPDQLEHKSIKIAPSIPPREESLTSTPSQIPPSIPPREESLTSTPSLIAPSIPPREESLTSTPSKIAPSIPPREESLTSIPSLIAPSIPPREESLTSTPSLIAPSIPPREESLTSTSSKIAPSIPLKEESLTSTSSVTVIQATQQKTIIQKKSEPVKDSSSILLKQAKEDTILRFAAVELGGMIQKT